jgi:glycosyltransferase involved in cell wall biosynthesis
MPTVSVIVPNYNHATYLPQRIESILGQTYQDFELILLDDCSTDDSRAVLSRYASDPRVRLEFNQVNSGSAFKQWNKGVRLARGKYIWIAESDDYADGRFLERLVPILDRDPAVAYAYCRSWQITADARLQGFHDEYGPYKGPRGWDADYCVDGRQECRDYFLFMTPVSNASAAIFRKSAYDSVGGADESMVLCGDAKLWAGIALTGRVAYISEPLNYYRLHQATQRARTANRSVGVIEGLQNVRWLLDRLDLSEAEIARVYRTRADAWVPALMSPRVPLRVKRQIFGYAKAIDPHPARRVLAPAIQTVRHTLARRWRSLLRGGVRSSAPDEPARRSA